METLKKFIFNENQVRVIIDDNNEPLFCGPDVTDILGYPNGRDAIGRHCKKEGVGKYDTPTDSGNQQITFITEGNLYRLILKSNKPEAEPFERFVCDEVLPSIRKKGLYASDSVIEKAIQDPDFIINILTELKSERAAKENLRITTELQARELKEAAPKVEYYHEVLQSENLILTNVIAKDLGMSAVRLNKILHANRIIYKSGDTWVLYEKYQNKGYTRTRTHTYTDEFGIRKTQIHNYWTEKGREFVIEFIKSLHK
jgi:prophage antirepressor-like protein